MAMSRFSLLKHRTTTLNIILLEVLQEQARTGKEEYLSEAQMHNHSMAERLAVEAHMDMRIPGRKVSCIKIYTWLVDMIGIHPTICTM